VFYTSPRTESKTFFTVSIPEVLDLPDCCFTCGDYRYRFEPEAKQRFLDLLRERFNCGISYRGRALKWDTVIEQKTAELGRYFVDRTCNLDLSDPSPTLRRSHDLQLRRRILDLSYAEAQRLGICKSTLYHLRSNAGSCSRFRVYRKVLERLTKASQCQSHLRNVEN
jgi:hypothetical protein